MSHNQLIAGHRQALPRYARVSFAPEAEVKTPPEIRRSSLPGRGAANGEFRPGPSGPSVRPLSDKPDVKVVVVGRLKRQDQLMRVGRRNVALGAGAVLATSLAARASAGAPAKGSALSVPPQEHRVMGARELLAEYEQRLNEHTFDAVQPLIASDAVFWFNDGSYSGLAAIQGAFERTFAAFPLERYWLEDVRWIASGDAVAACVYQFRWTAVSTGRQVNGGGRGTTVLRLENGAWKIVHEHLSQEPRKHSAA